MISTVSYSSQADCWEGEDGNRETWNIGVIVMIIALADFKCYYKNRPTHMNQLCWGYDIGKLLCAESTTPSILPNI